MKEGTLRAAALAIVPAVITTFLIQACGGSSDAVAQSSPPAGDPVEGVWDSVITARDCTTNAALATFRGMNMLHRGGTVTDTNASPISTRGPGFGTWTRAGDTYTAKFQFYTYGADGVVTGIRKVTRVFTLSADGNTSNATNTNELVNLAGTVIERGCGTDVSTRVR